MPRLFAKNSIGNPLGNECWKQKSDTFCIFKVMDCRTRKYICKMTHILDFSLSGFLSALLYTGGLIPYKLFLTYSKAGCFSGIDGIKDYEVRPSEEYEK